MLSSFAKEDLTRSLKMELSEFLVIPPNIDGPIKMGAMLLKAPSRHDVDATWNNQIK